MTDIQKQVDDREMLIEELHKIKVKTFEDNRRQGVTARVVIEAVVKMLELIVKRLK